MSYFVEVNLKRSAPFCVYNLDPDTCRLSACRINYIHFYSRVIFLSPTGQPTIELYGLPIMEPMVTFTDLWITIVCLCAFFNLRKKRLSGRIHQYMRYYFLIMAIATFLGGVLGHAFQYAVGIEWKLPGWLISMIAVMAIERASIFQAQPFFRATLVLLWNGLM